MKFDGEQEITFCYSTTQLFIVKRLNQHFSKLMNPLSNIFMILYSYICYIKFEYMPYYIRIYVTLYSYVCYIKFGYMLYYIRIYVILYIHMYVILISDICYIIFVYILCCRIYVILYSQNMMNAFHFWNHEMMFN